MCVIAVKPIGVEMPSETKMRQMFEANSDGAGFMFVRNGKVIIRKGFMKFKHFRKAVEQETLTNDDLVVMHFRIATAGSVSRGNCHPFPVTDNIRHLKSERIETDLAIAHNGILSYAADKKNDLSDTMTFVREILADPFIRSNIFESAIFSLIEQAIGSNKIVIVGADKKFSLLGFWQEDTDKDGIFYSNLGFKARVFYSSSNNDYWSNNRSRSSGGVQYSNWDKEDEFAEKESSAIVSLHPNRNSCPNCHYPIASKIQLCCTKCGIIFDRDNEGSVIYAN